MNDLPDQFEEVLAFIRQALAGGRSLLVMVATVDGEAKTDAAGAIRAPSKLNHARLALLVAEAHFQLAVLTKTIANEQRDARLFLDLLMHCVKIKMKPPAEPPPGGQAKETTS